jgi:RNA polymerase sigma-70 factor, ECF subfamily
MSKSQLREPTEGDGETLGHLICCISKGDLTALQQLKQLTGAYLFGIAYQYLRNRADADEVVGDVYIRVWFRSHRFDPCKGTAGAWLSTLCRNAAIDFFRRIRRREVPYPVESGSGEDLSPELIVERWQMQEWLFAAIEQLPVPQRRLMLFTYRDGLSHREIANTHNVPLGTVKSHINRGLNRLRNVVASG